MRHSYSSARSMGLGYNPVPEISTGHHQPVDARSWAQSGGATLPRDFWIATRHRAAGGSPAFLFNDGAAQLAAQRVDYLCRVVAKIRSQPPAVGGPSTYTCDFS